VDGGGEVDGRPAAGHDAQPLKEDDPLDINPWQEAERVCGGGATVAIGWPCRLDVESYVAAGRGVAVPRPRCPACQRRLIFSWW
jgi:hypothetical protein